MDEQREEVSEGTRAAEAWVIGAAAGAVVLALLFGAYQIGFSEGEKQAEPQTEQSPPPSEPAAGGGDGGGGGGAVAAGPGQELFVASCGSCHVLEAAGTSGAIGPDLDALAPAEEQVLSAIENGGTGSGQMPAGLLAGDEAAEVSAYVAESAGSG